MKNKLILIFTLILCCSGCYNYNELNTLAIATGMSIDYKDNKYVVNLLIANSKQAQVSTKEGEAQSIVYEGKGRSISEAIKEIDVISPKKIYIGHLSFIVVSEDLAKEGLEDSLDYLLRDPESIKRFYLILAREKEAKDILKIVSPLESFPSQSISIAISFSKESQAVASNIPYSSFIEKLIQKGNEPILPTIELKGNEKKGSSSESLKESTPKAYLKLSNLALFKKDKLLHITNETESAGINIINGDAEEMLIDCNCSGGKLEVAIRNLKSNVKVSLKDNHPKATISISTVAAIQESTCKLDLEDNQVVLDLEEKVKEEIKRLMNEAINVTQKYETDIFGIGNLFYKFHPKYFKKVEKTWNEKEYKNLEIEKKVNVRLESKGSIESRIKEN